MPLSPEQENTLTDLAGSAAGINTRLDSFKQWLIASVAIVAIGVVVCGFYTWSVHTDLRRTHTATTAARLGVCHQDVAKAQNQAEIEKQLERQRRKPDPALAALVKRIEDQLGISPAEVAASAARTLAAYDLKVDQEHKIRKCTPDGIADYYAGRGGYLPTPTTTTSTVAGP